MAALNSREIFKRTLAGEKGGPVPIWPQAFLFPGVFAGFKQTEYSNNADKIVAAQVAALEAYGWDAVGTYPDIVMEPEAYGCKTVIPEDREPYVTKDVILAGEKKDGLGELKTVDPWQMPRMRVILEATKELKKRVGDKVLIFGGQRSPLSLSCELRGIEQFMMDTVLEPEFAHALLDFSAEHAIRYALAQLEAGADVIELGNSSGSLISPDMYEEFVKPRLKRVFEAVAKAGGIPCLHSCGKTDHLHHLMAETGAAIVEIDYLNNMPEVVTSFQNTTWLGNIDPVSVLLQSSPEKIHDAVTKLLNDTADKGKFVLSTGCEPPMYTPPENMRAFVEAGKKFNQNRKFK